MANAPMQRQAVTLEGELLCPFIIGFVFFNKIRRVKSLLKLEYLLVL